MSKTTIVDFYQVDQSDQPVVLNVIIGYAQNAVTTVKINSLNMGDYERSFNLVLGNNKELVNKELFCFTTVHDINPDTNKTSVSVTLTGGVQPYEGNMDVSVSSNGGIASYTIHIGFFN